LGESSPTRVQLARGSAGSIDHPKTLIGIEPRRLRAIVCKPVKAIKVVVDFWKKPANLEPESKNYNLYRNFLLS